MLFSRHRRCPGGLRHISCFDAASTNPYPLARITHSRTYALQVRFEYAFASGKSPPSSSPLFLRQSTTTYTIACHLAFSTYFTYFGHGITPCINQKRAAAPIFAVALIQNGHPTGTAVKILRLFHILPTHKRARMRITAVSQSTWIHRYSDTSRQ